MAFDEVLQLAGAATVAELGELTKVGDAVGE
jgi:hypothetical protein